MHRVQSRVRAAFLIAAGLCVLGAQILPAQAAPAAPGTNWDLTDLYATPKAWDESYARTRAAIGQLGAYRDTLGQSDAAMLKALLAISDLKREMNRLTAYASLNSDQDLRVAANLERYQQAQALNTQLKESTSWVAPELLRVGADRINAFRKANPALEKSFGYYLDNTLRAVPHTLGDEAEHLLASAGSLLAQPDTLHSQLADAELPVPIVTLSDGQQAHLTDPAYETAIPLALATWARSVALFR